MSMVSFYDIRVLKFNLMLFSVKVTQKIVIQTPKTYWFTTGQKYFHYSMQNPKSKISKPKIHISNISMSKIQFQNFGITPKMCKTKIIL